MFDKLSDVRAAYDAWSDGTTHLLFEPFKFLGKLAALTPRPEITLVLYHGLRAPHARWRTEVLAYSRAERTGAIDPSEVGISIRLVDSGAGRPRDWTWVALMRRATSASTIRMTASGGASKSISTVALG